MSTNPSKVDEKSMKQKMEEQNEKVSKNLERIKHKIVVMSGKGGVGKSTVATNLATSLAMSGREVGLMDVDIHGPDIPKMLNIENERPTGDGDSINPIIVPPHLKVMSMAFLLSSPDAAVIWRGPIKMGVIRQFLGDVQWGNLDYLIIDMPPGTGDEPLSIAQLIPGGDVIIVTTPQDVALLDVSKAVTFTRTLNLSVIGIIENMSGFACPHCGEKIDLFGVGGGERAAEDMGICFLGRIPIDPEIVKTGDEGKPFVVSHRDSQAVKSFEEITEKIEEILEQ